MSTPVYDSFGDEMSRGNVEDNMPSPRYRAKLALHPDCRDPEHPGCEECEDPETGEPLVNTGNELVSDETPMAEIAAADVARIVTQLRVLLRAQQMAADTSGIETEILIDLLTGLFTDATGEVL